MYYLSNPIFSYFSIAISFFKATLYKLYSPYISVSKKTVYSPGRRHEATTFKTDSLDVNIIDICAETERNDVVIFVLLKLNFNIFKPHIMYAVQGIVIITLLNIHDNPKHRRILKGHLRPEDYKLPDHYLAALIIRKPTFLS